jgi:hypothetical protein
MKCDRKVDHTMNLHSCNRSMRPNSWFVKLYFNLLQLIQKLCKISDFVSSVLYNQFIISQKFHSNLFLFRSIHTDQKCSPLPKYCCAFNKSGWIQPFGNKPHHQTDRWRRLQYLISKRQRREPEISVLEDNIKMVLNTAWTGFMWLRTK